MTWLTPASSRNRPLAIGHDPRCGLIHGRRVDRAEPHGEAGEPHLVLEAVGLPTDASGRLPGEDGVRDEAASTPHPAPKNSIQRRASSAKGVEESVPIAGTPKSDSSHATTMLSGGTAAPQDGQGTVGDTVNSRRRTVVMGSFRSYSAPLQSSTTSRPTCSSPRRWRSATERRTDHRSGGTFRRLGRRRPRADSPPDGGDGRASRAGRWNSGVAPPRDGHRPSSSRCRTTRATRRTGVLRRDWPVVWSAGQTATRGSPCDREGTQAPAHR